MAKSQPNPLLVIAIVVAAVFLFNKGAITQQAILPSGQINAYPDLTTCTYITNVDPITSRYSASYGNGAAWISIDTDGDGLKEKWGFYAEVNQGSRQCGCGGSCPTGKSSQILITDYNTAGDDIYKYNTGTEIAVTVCSSSGYAYRYYKLNYRSAQNAIDSCPAQTCACGQWSNQQCGGGSCTTTERYQTRTCSPQGCTPPDGLGLGKCIADQSCAGDIACSTNADCGTNTWVGTASCNLGNVYQNYRTFLCTNPGTVNSACSSTDDYRMKTNCNGNGCSGGVCTGQQQIVCSANSDCGADTWTGSPSCSNNDIYQPKIIHICNSPGSVNSFCSTSQVTTFKTDCGVTSDSGWGTCSNCLQTKTIVSRGCGSGICYSTTSTPTQSCGLTNGGWTTFSGWGTCSVPCGGGTQTRTRTCTNPAPACGGATCSGSATESQSCNTQSCSCTYSDWSPSVCPASCQQTRYVTSGTGCTGSLTQSCTGGSCGQTCTEQQGGSDCCMALSELMIYANKWISKQIQLPDLMTGANNWINRNKQTC